MFHEATLCCFTNAKTNKHYTCAISTLRHLLSTHAWNKHYLHVQWWSSASRVNASVMPSAQLMDLVKSALMACYDLNTERHWGSAENKQQVVCLSVTLAFVLIPNASGQAKERQEKCVLSGCIYLLGMRFCVYQCVSGFNCDWGCLYGWFWGDVAHVGLICLRVYNLSTGWIAGKGSYLGCCPNIRACCMINRYLRVHAGSNKPGCLSQMHAVYVFSFRSM